MAVRVRLCHQFGRDKRGAAGPVIGDHLLSPQFAKLLRDDASDEIKGAAGGERNDDAYRARRVVVGVQRTGQHSESEQGRIDDEPHVKTSSGLSDCCICCIL